MNLNNQPLVSIMMNCYNGAKYLNEAIDSVLSQTYENWEIIFWDNQSIDESASIVKQYKDKRIKYYYAPKFTNLFEARRLAYEKCNGTYLAFLDVDDIWLPTKLEKQVAILKHNKNIVLVHTNTIFFDTHRNISFIANKQKLASGKMFSDIVINYKISLETVIIRKETVDSNNILFSNYYNLIGDRDYFTTVSYYGEVYYIDEVLGKWRIHQNNFSKQLKNQHPKELKHMYLRFKNRFKEKFTYELRKNILEEIVLREALILLNISGTTTRNKLNKINFFIPKSIFLRLMSFLPSSIAISIIKFLRN